MNLAIEPAQSSALTESIHEILPLDADGIQANHDLLQSIVVSADTIIFTSILTSRGCSI